ncbi:hypothetical protein DFJ58DRAFT_737079 [Suillus subalutaceus]|uniref:uncharacterized protein n=1 Tax=Suillus subalutaceus TaxID=48586 RepID=UPI001B879060|nr:uncharacterized protein DFJ58DRAFT_737079 [Suillus subalutaceus]KAG1830081.1 hypothetical protein DFJ58DRAFT_737079 [Suillus subalutaceus]
MASASPRSSPLPANTDLPTNENAVDANAVTEEPAVSIEVGLHKNMSSTLEQIRDEIMPNNTSEEHVVCVKGNLARNKSDTLEQTPENGIKPNSANKNPAVSIEGSLAKKM